MKSSATGLLPFASVLLLLSCSSSLGDLAPSDHVVAAPISERANVVLHNLVMEYGSSDGRWRGCLSPGCTPIWAAQFGFRAGVRRDRDDVLAIGTETAGHESGEIRGLFWDSLFGDVDENDPALMGFPALLASGVLGGNGTDAWIFEQGLSRLKERRPEGFRPRENAGLAALFAEVAGLDPEGRAEWLDLAREHAETAAGDVDLAFFAWSAIARASGEGRDAARAREAESATSYRFDTTSGALSLPPERMEVLSHHLAVLHGYADLAQTGRDPSARSKAVTLLDRLFSDAWFDGRFLIHDRLGDKPSKDVCSGCNFMALYLVDRIYGDSFVIDPVPPLPERDWPDEERSRTIDETFVLEADQAEFTRSGLDPEGRWLWRHATKDVQVLFTYRLAPSAELEPRGGVVATIDRRGADADVRGRWTHYLPFDEDGVVDFELYYGFAPLMYSFGFRRDEGGELSATVRLKSGE